MSLGRRPAPAEGDPLRCSRRRAGGLALGLGAAALTACRARPYNLVAAHPDIAAQVITRRRAWAILAEAPPEVRRRLEQLMFLADLPTASGNEDDPLRFYRRVERELTPPLAVGRAEVDVVLADMLAILMRHTESAAGRETRGYDVVTAMLSPAGGALPSPGDALQAIQGHPPRIAAAFLIVEYFADHHYHTWNMQETLTDALLAGDHGPAPLVVYEDYLRQRYPSTSPASTYHQVALACQRELGDDFDPWYRSLRGESYRRATFRR